MLVKQKVGNAGTAGMVMATTTSEPLIEEISDLCKSSKKKASNIETLASQVKSEFAKMHPKPTPEAYSAVVQLVNTDIMKSTVSDMKALQSMAKSCVTKSKKLTKTFEDGTRDLPQSIKTADGEASGAEGESQGTEEVDEDHEINDIESDIAEINASTKSLESMNWFTAQPKGTYAFANLSIRGEIVRTLFRRMKELVTSIGTISETFLTQGCGSKMRATVTGAKDMLRCLRMSKTLEKFAQLALTAIQAIVTFLKTAWTRIKAFVKEYQAARKIQKFTNGLKKEKEEDWDVMTSIAAWVPSDSTVQTTIKDPIASCFG
mmetsp:Transcript_21004/g.29653  ORF Transcript_21004/g.29653 Transcript_21004/m.29653 type:complete len:319 (-) Transcript_21004:229-1185(-)